MKQTLNSVQEWIPIEEFYCDGIIKLKNNNLIKIVKIIPINYELKTNFEKKSILNLYKTFLKNCNFEIQIIIKSGEEDLSKNINKLEKNKNKENSLNNSFIVNISDQYINYIQIKNSKKISATKTFYILIKSKKEKEKTEEIQKIELEEKVLKIRNALGRCGNIVIPIRSKKELENIIISFFN